jgi:hypothetical protein
MDIKPAARTAVITISICHNIINLYTKCGFQKLDVIDSIHRPFIDCAQAYLNILEVIFQLREKWKKGIFMQYQTRDEE